MRKTDRCVGRTKTLLCHITNERYVYIFSIIKDCCTKNRKEKLTTSDKIDMIVTNRWLALPAYHLPTVGNVLRSMWERGCR